MADAGRGADSELQRERKLLDILEKSRATGDLSDDEYEATKQDIASRIAQLEEEAARQAPPVGEGSASPPKGFTLGCGGIIALVVLVFAITTIKGCVSEGGGGVSAETARAQAQVACRDAVRRLMKDPGSAKFDNETVRITGSSAPIYSYDVTGTVRGTNSFGGTAVHEFVCDATYSVTSGEAEAKATVL